jgi:predicted  nucleic acid-binding Zn-ribbon protein
MEAFNILENKIITLLELVKKLKAENGDLKKESEQLGLASARLMEESAKLRDENTALHEHVEQLMSELDALEKSVFARDKNVETLNLEKAETKLLIDDLIKDIDSLVESENR